VAAGVGVLVVAGLIVFWFAVLPGELAADYKDGARKESHKVESALRRVYETFNAVTFGEDARAVKKAKSPSQYLKALHRGVGCGRRSARSGARAPRSTRWTRASCSTCPSGPGSATPAT
jgi:hypothetical protein